MTGKRRFGLLIASVAVAILVAYCIFEAGKSAQLVGEAQAAPAAPTANGWALGGPTAASPGLVPPDTPPPPNRLSGVYAGMHFGTGPGASAVAEIRVMALYPDGTGMYLPGDGLDGYDLGRDIQGGLEPINYGTYQYHNNHVDFRSQDGTATGFDVGPTGQVPTLDRFIRTCHCNGARFGGTYYWGLQDMSITFLPDGRFVDRGAMHDCFQFNFYQNQHLVDPGVGTYRIVDYTLHLDYADGRHLKRSFVLTTPDQTPEGLWIGGARFKPVPGTIGGFSPAQINPQASVPANPANFPTNVAPNTGGGSRVLAAGSTPLTKEVAENFDNFLVWVFDIRLTPQQMELMEQDLVATWGATPPEQIQFRLEVAALYERISASPADQQAQTRQTLQPRMLSSLRAQQNDPICRMLLNAYESQHRGAASRP